MRMSRLCYATARMRVTTTIVRQAIARELLAGLAYRTAPTAYHLWLELPPRWRPEALALSAHRTRVEVTPAEAFSVNREHEENAIRVSLSGVDSREELRMGLKILRELVEGRDGSSATL